MFALAPKTHPTVERSGPLFAAGTGFNAHCVGNLFDNIAETYFLLFDEARETNAMRLAFGWNCWFFLPLGTHCFASLVHYLQYVLCRA